MQRIDMITTAMSKMTEGMVGPEHVPMLSELALMYTLPIFSFENNAKWQSLHPFIKRVVIHIASVSNHVRDMEREELATDADWLEFFDSL